MRKLIFIYIIALAGCGTSSIKQEVETRKIKSFDCSNVAIRERLDCIASTLPRYMKLLDSAQEKLLEQKIVESDAYCVRVEQTWERGSTLPPEERIIETRTFPVCRYATFWERLKGEFFSFGLGVGVGAGISKGMFRIIPIFGK